MWACTRQVPKATELSDITYVGHLSLRRLAKLQVLTGKKCLVDCFFDFVVTQVLWDTGSQVTIINKWWRQMFFPHIKLHNMDELLDKNETLIGRV